MATTIDQAIIEIHGEIGSLRSDFAKANAEVDKFEGKTKRSFKSLGRAAFSLKSAFAGIGAGLAVRDIVKTAVEFEALENKMKAATGSAEASAAGMEFVRAEAERLGIDLLAAGDGFAGFSASALRAGLTFGDTKQIFADVGDAVASLGLSAERTGLVFRALEQMASKGVVSMEELKLQLGDSLPGALEIAARSMGVTSQQFIKMVENGEVMSKDFLPQFAKAIKEELGGSVEEAANSARANMNRLKTAFIELKLEVANSGFMDSFNESVKELTLALKDPDMQEGLANLADGLGKLIVLASKGAAAFGGLLGAIISLKHQGLEALEDRGVELEKLGIFSEAFLEKRAEGVKKLGEQFDLLANKVVGVKTASMDSMSLGAGASATGGAGEELGGGGGKSLFEQILGTDDEGIESELQKLQDALLSAEELQLASHDRRLAQIQAALESEFLLTEEQRNLLLELEQAHEDAKTRIKEESARKQAQTEKRLQGDVAKMRQRNQDHALGILKTLVGDNKGAALAILAIEKGLAISRMLINTEVAAMRALSDLGPIAGAPVAAAIRTQGAISAGLIAAQGLAQAATSGGSGSSVSSGGSFNTLSNGNEDATLISSAPTAPQTQVNITLEGQSYSESDVRELIEAINDQITDNVRIN